MNLPEGSIEGLRTRWVLVEQIPQVGGGLMGRSDGEKQGKPPVGLERRDVYERERARRDVAVAFYLAGRTGLPSPWGHLTPTIPDQLNVLLSCIQGFRQQDLGLATPV